LLRPALLSEQAKAEGDAAGVSAELAAERDSLAAELQQSQQALDSMQVRSKCSSFADAARIATSRRSQCARCDGHVTGRVTESDPGVGGVQEQLWAYEDADTQREALEARLAASEAECQQLRADLAAAQHSALEVHRFSL
jgi:hypothetical protein